MHSLLDCLLLFFFSCPTQVLFFFLENLFFSDQNVFAFRRNTHAVQAALLSQREETDACLLVFAVRQRLLACLSKIANCTVFFFRGVVRLLRCSQEDCPCLWFFCICYSSVLFQCNHKEKKVPSFYNCLNKRRTKINYHVESEGDRSLFFFIYLLVQSQQH